MVDYNQQSTMKIKGPFALCSSSEELETEHETH